MAPLTSPSAAPEATAEQAAVSTSHARTKFATRGRLRRRVGPECPGQAVRPSPMARPGRRRCRGPRRAR
eukprot:8012906-Pyramimonas_sp.AAC.1